MRICIFRKVQNKQQHYDPSLVPSRLDTESQHAVVGTSKQGDTGKEMCYTPVNQLGWAHAAFLVQVKEVFNRYIS